MAPGGHFGWPKITFDHISRHFRSRHNLAAILDDRKSLSVAFLAILDQYAIFNFFEISCTKCAILDDRKSLSITFLTISNQYAAFFFLNFFTKWTEKHFWSNFSPFQINTQLLFFLNFFTKWPPVAILDDRKSLSIAFLAISDQYATFIFLNLFSKWPPIGFFHSRSSMAVSNTNLIRTLVSQLRETQALVRAAATASGLNP